ncbi:hypothetical protein [Sphingobacterium thalpophilum]|uniref:hypothetical protein n=1 Tax=Sphingobacterium thalpophilum TaxID=259 RepID=UPI003D97ABB6
MKRIILAMSITALFACGGSTNKTDDSKSVTPIFADTTETKYDPAAAKVVYDKVNFGITKKEYEKLMPNTFNKIGDYEYTFYPEYDENGKLYLLQISTPSVNAGEIETRLTDYKNNLYKVISQKYQAPSKDHGNINFFDFKPGYIQWQYEWNIHTKTIVIGMGENSSQSTYTTQMWIYDKPTFDRIRKQREEQSNKNTSSDADKF